MRWLGRRRNRRKAAHPAEADPYDEVLAAHAWVEREAALRDRSFRETLRALLPRRRDESVTDYAERIRRKRDAYLVRSHYRRGKAKESATGVTLKPATKGVPSDTQETVGDPDARLAAYLAALDRAVRGAS